MDQDNKGQPQQGGGQNKPDQQQGQQPGQNRGSSRRSSRLRSPARAQARPEFERTPPIGGVLVFRPLRSQALQDDGSLFRNGIADCTRRRRPWLVQIQIRFNAR